ncbi:MAG: RnfABCDGE type electron transport complex subunit G [Actinobacteria bacterium]|nr:RnfABCDGE type electron transport complex subunit G [Actinomycetota bacterium]
MKDIIKLGAILTIICIIAAASLSFTYALTEKRIERQKKLEELRAFREVLPSIKSSKGFKERKDLLKKVQKKFKDVQKIVEGFLGNKRVGFAVQVAPRGYGGPITMVVGIDNKGRVAGIGLVSHKETPGLGGEIETSGFQRQFKKKSENDPIEVNKDIDAISGATRSSKAVANGVKEALEVYLKMQD